MSYIGRQLNVPASRVQLTADGAITAGKPCIVDADGNVAQVTENNGSQAAGSAVVFDGSIESHALVYDASAEKVVIFYKDGGNSNYGTAIVGTISGSSVSFGTPAVFNSASTAFINCVYDSNAQKIVVAYRDNGDAYYGNAVVGTVSGTSVSFGSEATFSDNSVANYNVIAYDSNAQKVVIAYQDDNNSGYGTAVVGTVSGTSISFGTATVFESASSAYEKIIYDASAQKVVIAYQDGGNSSKGTAVVGTVSGTSISFGTAVEIQGTGNGYERHGLAYDESAQKVVFAYNDVGNTNQGTGVVGTVSGTSISFGSEVVFETGATYDINAAYHALAEKVVIVYRDNGNSDKGTAVVGTVSGTSITFNTPNVYGNTASDNTVVYDASAQKMLIAYRDYGSSNDGKSLTYQIDFSVGNLTAENFIGFAENDCTDNGLATIQLGGSVNDKQTSLTAGQTYFVQTDGTIGTTADSPSVTAGTAVSSTEILVKG